MTYQSTEKGYVFWRDVLLLPIKREGKKTGYFRKETPFENAPNYWEYSKEDEQWNLYYVKRGKNRRLAVANIGEFSPQTIIAKISDREITVADCGKVEDYQRERHCTRGPKVIATTNWSVEFDGKQLLALLIIKEKMSYEEVVRVITNEGGYVDSEGIIHKGSAENKIREL